MTGDTIGKGATTSTTGASASRRRSVEATRAPDERVGSRNDRPHPHPLYADEVRYGNLRILLALPTLRRNMNVDRWQPLLDEVVEDLRSLIRMPTVNPPGNEGPAIDYIVAKLREAGIEPLILESDGRPNVVARIEGHETGDRGPLLLAGHVDVVPVEPEHWTQDPFGADIVDGYMYGRGTIDMKHMVVMCLHAFLRIAQSPTKPNRDVIFAAVSDEEAGCSHGSKYLVEEHAELVRAEYMLGEFGGFSLDVGGVRYYPIQIGEKGVCQFELIARGDPGHGSIPHANNAVVKLARAVQLLGTKRLPHQALPEVQAFILEMASHQPAPARYVLPGLLNPLLCGPVLDYVLPDKSVAAAMAANLANTVSPTMLSAGKQKNVIPGEARAVCDGRLLPGQTKDDLFRQVRDIIGDDYEFELITYSEGRVNKDFANDPLYHRICSHVRRNDPSGVPVPYLASGFTDAQQFGRLGAQCYGYAPMRFPKGDDIKFAKLVHGHDERIHVEGYRWGARCFIELVESFVGVTL